ncbi:MAG: hypothetical protein Q9175_005200 [Cornicularia normoerica]
MPFREKMRKALGRSNDDGSDLTTTDTNKSTKSKKAKKEKLPDNVYKPGEPMPRPKYRGPYNQAHQDKLSAFSFGDAWKRRRSSGTVGSDLSPMGSRIISRRNSAWSKKSKLGSRQNSAFAGVEESGEGDDDVANVGLSRQHTAENRRPRTNDNTPDMTGLAFSKTVTNGDVYGLDAQKTVTNGRLFTEDELAKAMTQSTLKPSRRQGE